MNEAQKITQGLIEMLKTKGRLDLLPEIITELNYEQDLLQQQVVVESAVMLNESDLHELIEIIADKYGFKPQVIKKINPNLLGGIKLKIGDQVIDLSLKYRLGEIKRTIN